MNEKKTCCRLRSRRGLSGMALPCLALSLFAKCDKTAGMTGRLQFFGLARLVKGGVFFKDKE